MAAFKAGKHVISDKPSGAELDRRPPASRCRWLESPTRSPSTIAATRSSSRRGRWWRAERRETVSFVHGHYLQDWMADPNVYSWRSDPSKGGSSSALGDIGSHWCDIAEHVSGLQIDSVLADLTTVIPVRYSAGASAEAFSNTRYRRPNPGHRDCRRPGQRAAAL
jgi:predicted dehydrogenase